MRYVLYGLLILVAIGILVNLIWRFVSNRRALPCPSWLGWLVEMENPLTRVNRAQFIIDHLGLKAGMRVLDAGCGPGRVTLPLAEAVGPQGEVVALDVQPEMLSRVQAKAEAAGLRNIQYLQAELAEGNLELKDIDRAILVSVLGEIPDQETAIREIYRVLKPGAVLSITEVIFDPHFQSRQKVRQLSDSAGLVEVDFLGNRLAYTMHLAKPGPDQ
jgi:ubiquinone/menaquinone biosynthesis C-methylase UbiE